MTLASETLVQGTLAPEVDPWPHRLTFQLRALCELSETLTLRLLELEERLAVCEGLLGRLDGRTSTAADGSAAVLDLLEQTEDRIARLESLLEPGPRGLASADPAQPPLQLLRNRAASGFPDQRPFTGGSASEERIAEDTFPEEGEQPFMDELIA